MNAVTEVVTQVPNGGAGFVTCSDADALWQPQPWHAWTGTPDASVYLGQFTTRSAAVYAVRNRFAVAS